MSNFLIYYTTSGVVWSIICIVKYKDISKQENIMGEAIRYVGIEIFVFLNFFMGFLNAPICIPIIINSFFLRRKIKRLQKENEYLTERNERIREKIRKQEDFNANVKNNTNEI